MSAEAIGPDAQAARPNSAQEQPENVDCVRPVAAVRAPRSKRRFLQRVHEVIAEHVTSPEFDVQHVADALGISKRTLERRMSQVTGMSPAKYVRELRLLRASSLVEVGDVTTVHKLASSVGFRDADYFSRLYRRTFGTSPAELLR